MDGSFLSQAPVIDASRKFICVRLLTYEDAGEAKFLRTLFLGRSGDLENSLFAVLKPDGKETLVRAHRSPRHDFEDASQLAETMTRVAKPYADTRRPTALPLLPNVRLAVNTAACDNQPLVIVFAEDAKERKRLETTLADLAWTDAHVGRFAYVSTAATEKLAAIKGRTANAAVLVIQPDRFGTGGTVLAQTETGATRDQISQTLSKGLSQHRRRDKSFGMHVREGQNLGVFWETAIPVTDPWEKQARERGRKVRP